MPSPTSEASRPMSRARRIIDELLAYYDEGLVTRGELASKVAFAALAPDFAAHLEVLPKDVVESLWKYARTAVGHPEDVLILRSHCSLDPFGAREFDKKERFLAYWSSRRLRELFVPNEPMPPFEPVRLCGRVNEVRREGGRLLLLGDFETWLLRDNVLVAVAVHTGERRVLESREWVAVEPSDEGGDPATKPLPLACLLLSERDSSWASGQGDLELWVDRSSKLDLLNAPPPTLDDLWWGPEG